LYKNLDRATGGTVRQKGEKRQLNAHRPEDMVGINS